MSSNLRVNSITPSSGNNVAIGTAGGTISLVTNVSGISTFATVRATSIVGVSTVGVTTAYVGSINDGPISGARNRIINGDMRIDQRNNGASVNTNDAFPVDRFQMNFSGGGIITGQRSGIVPVGFTSSLSLTASTADTSIAAGDFYNLQQKIEGFNVADLGFGAASASSITLSFWVRSSVTGTYGGALNNSAANRSYVFTYSISASNTWEYKTITILGDTSGTWLNNNGIGFRLLFDLGSGTTFNGTANTWNASNVFRTSGCVNWIANSAATFYITGVQLEAGTVATPFERRSFGQELALCYRYFQRVDWITTTLGSSGDYQNVGSLLVMMRTTPTLTSTNGTYTPVGSNGFRQTNNVTFGGTVITASIEL